VRGLKTTYYLRTMAATHVEKSTVAHGALNAVPSSDGGAGGAGGAAGGFGVGGGVGSSGVTGGFQASAAAAVEAAPEADGPVCMMRPGDPGFEECEACQ
jgi:ribonucleoside-diphosphate reductase alpha chain